MSIDPAAPVFPSLLETQTIIAKWCAADSLFADRLSAGMPANKALTLLGISLDLQGKPESAAEAFGVAASIAPGHAPHWTHYGMILDRLNQTSQAAFCLEQAVTLAPESPESWVFLGLVRRKLGDLPGAATACRKALEQAPGAAAAWDCLGLIKEAQFDYSGAIDCLSASAKLGTVNASLMARLGMLNYHLGRINAASEAFARAVELEPANLSHRQMLRKTRFMQEMLAGNLDQALECYQFGCQSDGACAESELPAMLKSAFALFSAFGPQDAAIRAGKKLIELQPANAEIEYLLRAVNGDQELERSPEKYVIDHFDDFAANFDSKLVSTLGYDLPDKIGEAIRSMAPDRLFDYVLDVGCGTGLCGPILRPIARILNGIDLSTKMIERAATRKTYDCLECAEIVEFLERTPLRFDLITAADVLVYIGDLRRFFSAVSRAMIPGGILAVSTEQWAGLGYHLCPSGRFAHAPDYVRQSAAKAGLTELTRIETTLRLEGSTRIPGDVHLLFSQ